MCANQCVWFVCLVYKKKSDSCPANRIEDIKLSYIYPMKSDKYVNGHHYCVRCSLSTMWSSGDHRSRNGFVTSNETLQYGLMRYKNGFNLMFNNSLFYNNHLWASSDNGNCCKTKQCPWNCMSMSMLTIYISICSYSLYVASMISNVLFCSILI